MEASSLVKAQDHARAASAATQISDTTVAITEHVRAAGEFANAAKSTTSVEALRQLKLLEQYHQRLSELLKFPHENPVGHASSEADGNTGEKGSNAGARGDAPPLKRESSKGDAASKTATSQQKRRYPPSRELSSSIASNLASARGIRSKYKGQPGQPVAPSISNDQAPGSLDGHRKDGSRAQMQSMVHAKNQPSWVPPSLVSQTSSPRAPDVGSRIAEEADAQGDEGFSRFYSTFGSIINRLSPALAFAGLPLSQIAEEEAAPAPEPKPRPSKTTQSSDPDVFKIYSKATLRALNREGNGPADSFYVVPKTGHTASYANILNYDHKEKRRIAASIHGDEDFLDDPDEDDFVDARESQGVQSAYKKRSSKSRTEKEYMNTIEELHTKNASLADMIDKLSKRLHAFEANAQQSHMALQESMRFMRPTSPMSSSGGAKGSGGEDQSLKAANKRLEEDLALAVTQIEKLEKENVRMEKTLVKYRDKWDKLKAGAKARREAQGAESGAAAAASPFE